LQCERRAAERGFQQWDDKDLEYDVDGSYQVDWVGMTGEPYTSSYTVDHETNGYATSASFSNWLTATWTYNAGGFYDVAYAGVTEAALHILYDRSRDKQQTDKQALEQWDDGHLDAQS
jgi:hypothetical protein